MALIKHETIDDCTQNTETDFPKVKNEVIEIDDSNLWARKEDLTLEPQGISVMVPVCSEPVDSSLEDGSSCGGFDESEKGNELESPIFITVQKEPLGGTLLDQGTSELCDSSQKEKGSSRISLEQREFMFEFMLAHPALATGRFTAPDGAMQKAKLLDELALGLNSCGTGTSKTSDKWLKSWQDWRSDVKAKAAKVKHLACGRINKPFSLLEERLLAFLEPEPVGHAIINPLEAQETLSTAHSEMPIIIEEVEVVETTEGALPLRVLLTSSAEIPSPSPSSSVSKRKRRQSQYESPSEFEKKLSTVYEESNEVTKESLQIKREMLKIRKAELELQKETLQLKRETHARIASALETAAESFSNAMTMMAEYFRNK